MGAADADWAALDWAALAVLAVACLRGLSLGLVREVLSLLSLAAACVAVRFGATPGAAWLRQQVGAELDPRVALVAAAVGIVVVVLVLGGLAGRVLRSGARAAGLGGMDRAAGGVLGAAEGALVVAVGLLLVAAVLGRDHPLVAESRAFHAVERVEALARSRAAELPAVAAPPPDRPPEQRSDRREP